MFRLFLVINSALMKIFNFENNENDKMMNSQTNDRF